MSDQNTVSEASEAILEGAAEVAEGVVDMARGFSGLALSGAFVIGGGVGGAVAYFITSRRLETKYRKIADDEIAEMSEHWRAKIIALDIDTNKGDLEELVRERGYVPTEPETTVTPEPGQPPMVVAPPAAVVEAAQDEGDGDVVAEEPPVINAFEQYGDARPGDGDGWDWEKEKRRRTPLRPYVIHLDEREEFDHYDGVTFTYYEADDVVCNERDEVISVEDRERLLGEANLERFGHGSGDPTVVYIRNDAEEMVFEVCKSPNSYAEEVHGFEPIPPPSELRHSHRRARFDDD